MQRAAAFIQHETLQLRLFAVLPMQQERAKLRDMEKQLVGVAIKRVVQACMQMFALSTDRGVICASYLPPTTSS
jgi:hypothetical protein